MYEKKFEQFQYLLTLSRQIETNYVIEFMYDLDITGQLESQADASWAKKKEKKNRYFVKTKVKRPDSNHLLLFPFPQT